jgi:ribonuclease HI
MYANISSNGLACQQQAEYTHGKGGFMQNSVIIYTDGSCLGNPGPGGYAAILRYGAQSRELWGGEKQTTNNRMELTGAVRALEQLSRRCRVDIYIDSQYVLNGFVKGWIAQWKKKGWQTAGNKPVKNKDLWERLDKLNAQFEILWHYVPGHQGQKENERCDELARKAAQKAGIEGDFFVLGEHFSC